MHGILLRLALLASCFFSMQAQSAIVTYSTGLSDVEILTFSSSRSASVRVDGSFTLPNINTADFQINSVDYFLSGFSFGHVQGLIDFTDIIGSVSVTGSVSCITNSPLCDHTWISNGGSSQPEFSYSRVDILEDVHLTNIPDQPYPELEFSVLVGSGFALIDKSSGVTLPPDVIFGAGKWFAGAIAATGGWELTAVYDLTVLNEGANLPDTIGDAIFTTQSLSFGDTSAVVPIPAALWLFGSAIFGLTGVRRTLK